MIKLKKILALLTSSALVLSLAACSPVKEGASTSTKTSSKQTLNFGAMSSVDAAVLVIGNEKGYFKKEGVDVNLQTFKNSKDRDAAFQAGNLDGVICDEIAISLYQNADFDVKITGVTNGDFMLIANSKSGIKSVADLKGKSVAISEKTSIEYSLDKILEKNSIDPKEVKKSIVPAIPTRLEMLRNGNIDAALLPEPFASLALKDGGIRLGSAGDINVYSSVTAFTQKSIDSKSSEIKAFYKAYNEAVDYLNNTPVSEYEDTIIKSVGYPADMKGKLNLPKFKKNALPKEADVQAVIDWTVKNGLVKKTLTPKDVMNDIGIK
ncbi:ABC transporter substrate-binding protein [Clostridium folliculivorans]|uniref:ABC transporter substrate-binding protein n=1 Tax=Clostridium folliculivorans TaxID=2886038 RepID=A0A9W5Y4K5_9CLOT|nr:MetQ/NlpA family ABC transporter substrate-binding protein [Clostridium folliculivorans]GKU26546.1 ABC transporter substrate-binding protein [Clostridium folliculivorans]GKU29022.1 ABC transporter substrate-binding protein [Clostridium folliculivorans]